MYMSNTSIKYTINKKNLLINNIHLKQHPEMEDLLYPAFEKFLEKEHDFVGKIIKLEIKMDKIIGKTVCVKTDDSSDIFYAQRQGRNTFSRFVKNVEPQDCDTITMIVSRDNFNNFYLLTAYIGYSAQKEPLDKNIKSEQEFLESKKFWNNHALVTGVQIYKEDSVTNICPWNDLVTYKDIKDFHKDQLDKIPDYNHEFKKNRRKM